MWCVAKTDCAGQDKSGRGETRGTRDTHFPLKMGQAHRVPPVAGVAHAN